MGNRQKRAGGRVWKPVPCFLRLLASGLLALCATATTASAQILERPWLDWRTVAVGRFNVHFPGELEPWARFVAARMEAVDSAVATVVGFSPRGRVDIVIEDPYDIANGFAFTLLQRPVIVLWASPPDPRETVGEFRSWGEMLAVHEFAHVAHLTRPSRNPLTRALWQLSPLDLGPIALRAPRWAIEGYATYVEGVVTGSGRPHGFWRPAILRQWALEGRLPTYTQLSSWADFEGGDFAYLAGSAFLEWLARRQGDSSVVHIWRRLSARVNRSFDEAFAGVYGDAPRDLYGRFSAEITAQAVDAERAMAQAGIIAGDMVQHLSWGTGDPAISPDGARVALVLRSNRRPSRVVVWRTAPELDTLASRARERVQRRDPQDVPARRFYPPPRRPLATLLARGGRSFEDPRWMPDGKHILAWRATRRPDGSQRPDLYLWEVGTRSVRRVTAGAGVRDADPSPDGVTAVAIQCRGGHCDVVTVDLLTGRVRTIAEGNELMSFAHPRVSRDGRTIAVSLQRDNRWRIAVIEMAGGVPRVVDPDDGANRFDPAWLGPSSLVVASDRLGTANLERIDYGASATEAATVVRSLTRVIGAAVAPEPSRGDSSIWFLSLHSRGYDVRMANRNAPIGSSLPSVLLEPRLAPLVRDRVAVPRELPPRTLSSPRAYGFGSRTTRWVPIGAIGAEGRAGGLAIVNSDVVGRLAVLAQGMAGNGSALRGASVEAAWRGARPEMRASLWVARTDALTTSAHGVVFEDGGVELRGGRARIDFARAFDRADVRVGGGVAHTWLEPQIPASAGISTRSIAFGELTGTARQTGDGSGLTESLWMHVSGGRDNEGRDFGRGVVSLGMRAAMTQALPLDMSVTYGRVSADASTFERFVIGGLPSMLVDPSVLAQRMPMAALPSRVGIGDHVLAFRAATSLFGVAPFYWGASVRDGPGRFERWHRAAGVELTIDQTPLPVLGTPGARLTAGIARSLDAPLARATRAYLTLVLRP